MPFRLSVGMISQKSVNRLVTIHIGRVDYFLAAVPKNVGYLPFWA